MRWPLSLFSPTYKKESVIAIHHTPVLLRALDACCSFLPKTKMNPSSPFTTPPVLSRALDASRSLPPKTKKSVPRNRGTDLYE